jgi:DNA-binding NtrC family response regulator
MTGLQSKFSCLLVDDDPNIISLLESVFSDTSYQIYSARNGKSALALMEKVKIDATLIDLVMPEMDGITLLKEIKKDYPETMAIMLSGYGCIESAVKAVKLGAVDFLEKPISPEGLRFCLSQLYEKWKAKKENRTPGVKIEPRFANNRKGRSHKRPCIDSGTNRNGQGARRPGCSLSKPAIQKKFYAGRLCRHQ